MYSCLSALIKLLANMSTGIQDQLHEYEMAELTLFKPTQSLATVENSIGFYV